MATHRTDVVLEAQALAAGGWGPYVIAKIFKKRGTPVSGKTIQDWIDPRIAERRRDAQRKRMRRINAARTRGRLGAGPPRSPEFRLARMQSLRDLGMSYNAIAIVMNFDFLDEMLTGDRVRNMVRAREQS